ncbi:hypothetical protein [Mesobacillus selenatarsenatis]|uniref:Uncharacterized protein n=1 Tax=Mesobacillus selenatarsenatis TaxID=388741 RepID=A0A846TEV6_9BACI|nr:hypothetical protein [Mesobacillus selenatarsenatis]NKE03957.1 hypothetical protein [Mesobacillus selenatarsenatis]
MPCVIPGLTQNVCLTIIYNVSSQKLKDSFVQCVNSEQRETCDLEVNYNPVNTDLTIRVPFTIEGELTFTDNFQAFCVTTGVNITT